MNLRGFGKWRDAWPSRHGLSILAFLVAGSFLLFAQWQVLTYVCGNDPMLYIRAARVLLQPELYGPEVVRHSLTFVAPGYPLFLAGVIKLFGDLAPYWSNMAVFMATLPLMWLVFRRLMGSDRAAAFSILALLLIIFSGHPLHAPFLLYPFREVPRLFLVYLAYALLLAGMIPAGNRRLMILAASFALLAACAVREPSALVLPGMLLGMAGLATSWRERCHAWLWFLAPWLLGGVFAGFLVHQYALADFSQFSVLSYLGNHDVALGRIQQMLPWFPGRVGWIGLLLIGIGLIRAALYSRVLLAWFLVPAGLFFVFYAYMHMHDRYFLTSLLFLAVFAGYGLDWMCRGLQRLLTLRGPGIIWNERIGVALTVMVFGVLAVGLFQTAGQLRPWGPKVLGAEVREWQELVAGLDSSPDGRVRVAVEQRTRYLEDMLMSYTDADLLDPKRIDQWPKQWATAHYFHPLNRQAIWSTPQWLMHLEVVALRLLEHRMNLEPVGGATQSEAYRIGQGEYARYRLSPWRPGPHEQILDLASGKAQVLWMDWASTNPAMPREIILSDARTGEEWLRYSTQGNGLQALYLPPEMVVAAEAVLTVQSSVPLPSRPVIDVMQAKEMQHFSLGGDRRLSTNLFFPQMNPEDARPDFRHLRTDRELILKSPRLLSPVPAYWEVFLHGTFGDADSKLFIRGMLDSGSGFVRDPGAGSDALRFPVDSEKVLSLRLVAPFAPVDRRDVALEGVGFRVQVEE